MCYDCSMMTFLPSESFQISAYCLDYKRLGKQRVEARQIIDTLEGRSKGWIHHPAVKMWEGHVEALKDYFNEISSMWVYKGYKHNMGFYVVENPVRPAWIGNPTFHASHRAALLAKDYKFYSQWGWTEVPKIDYFWPVK